MNRSQTTSENVPANGAASQSPWWHAWRDRLLLQEDLNFLLTNRIPRTALTRAMGWFSRIEHPWVYRASMAIWRAFTDLDLSDAAHTDFKSLHACFTRELKPGARPFDERPDILASPCDAIVGACGAVNGTLVFQAKGFPYTLEDLLGSSAEARAQAEVFRDGCFVTLRLTSRMYHHFHAPDDLTVEHVTYFSGDTWNVNPIALRRVERLFCKNERAWIRARLASTGDPVALVPVAAVLVASLRLRWLGDVRLHLGYRGPNEFAVSARYKKGQDMGWFEHGSTILLFLPAGYQLAEGIETGVGLRAGQALLRRVAATPAEGGAPL